MRNVLEVTMETLSPLKTVQVSHTLFPISRLARFLALPTKFRHLNLLAVRFKDTQSTHLSRCQGVLMCVQSVLVCVKCVYRVY